MAVDTCSRMLDALDENPACDCCDLGPPIAVRRYYVAPLGAAAKTTFDLCDRCAHSLARGIERATNPEVPARLDADRTAKPKTFISAPARQTMRGGTTHVDRETGIRTELKKR